MPDDNLVTLATELGEKKSELSQATKTIEGLNSEIENLRTQLKEKEDKVSSLEASQTEDVKELTAAKEKAEKSISTLSEKLAPHVKAALVATGVKEEDVPTDDPAAMLALVEEKGLKLHQVFGADKGSADPGRTDVKQDDFAASRRKANFKVR